MRGLIRRATARDWKKIKELIRGNPHLQGDHLPSWHDFVVLQISNEVVGCCALRIYGPKMAEIRSLAFSSEELRKQYAKILVRVCMNRAQKERVYQLLVTVGKKDKKLFESLGFRPFNNEKYAMLMVVRNHELLKPFDIAGVVFRRAEESDRASIHALVAQYPNELIQPSSKLFPEILDFFVAVKDQQVVGCTALVVFTLKHGELPEMAEVRSVVVDRTIGIKGIGLALVMHCINWAIELNVWELLAITKIRTWFENLGFGAVRGAEDACFMVLGNGK